MLHFAIIIEAKHLSDTLYFHVGYIYVKAVLNTTELYETKAEFLLFSALALFVNEIQQRDEGF